jgi:hypothetical protein
VVFTALGAKCCAGQEAYSASECATNYSAYSGFPSTTLVFFIKAFAVVTGLGSAAGAAGAASFTVAVFILNGQFL